MKGIMLMKQKLCSRLFLAILFIVGILPSAFSASQDTEQLGKIAIPKDFELDSLMDTDILPMGEYYLSLRGGQLGMSYRIKDGLEYGFDIPTEAENTRENVQPHRIDVSIVNKAGADHVRIRVFTGLKAYSSLFRCAIDTKPEMLSAESLLSLDPQIIAELDVLKEALALLDRWSGTIWPNWTEYKSLEYSIVFPNRTKVFVTAKEKMPANFKQMNTVMPGGQKVFINRSKELPGRISSITGTHGRGGSGVVGFVINGMMDSGETESRAKKPGGNSVTSKTADDAMRFSRMMIYIHEAFHGMQNRRLIAAELPGFGKNPGMQDRSYSPTVDFSFYSEIEGEALIKAFDESGEIKALEYFKDFIVARELKLEGMPAGAASFDSVNTMVEGTAMYASFKMAMLIRDAGLSNKAGAQDRISAALARTDDYLDREMKDTINKLKGNTFDVTQKHYIYGAYWSLLLDRFFPSWKKGLFENYRSLDEVTANGMKMTDADKNVIADRLKLHYEYDIIRARHAIAIKERDDAVSSIANRKGKTYRIDLKHAQSGFDINPRQFIFNKGVQIYPRGLVGFVQGSLKLRSEETPMRLIQMENMLEWIDTDAKPGEKGYKLQYKSREGSFYKNVTLKTKGFSMSAKAIKIDEDGEAVNISIWD
jgi:hypothetical protein